MDERDRDLEATAEEIAEAYSALDGWEWAPLEAPVPSEPRSVEETLNSVAQYGAAVLFANLRKNADISLLLSEDERDPISVGLSLADMDYLDVWTEFGKLMRSSLDGTKQTRKMQIQNVRRILDTIEAELDAKPE